MKKEHLYACMCVFFITLSFCVICATSSYCGGNSKPVARIHHNYIDYEVQVTSPLDAARTYESLKSGCEKAFWESREVEQKVREAKEAVDRLAE